MKLFKTKNDNNDLNRKRPFLKRNGRDVHVDWTLSVIVAVLIAIGSVAFGYKIKADFFNNLKTEKTNISSKDTSNIDTKTLDRVLAGYEDKVRRREDLQRNYIGPADPSI